MKATQVTQQQDSCRPPEPVMTVWMASGLLDREEWKAYLRLSAAVKPPEMAEGLLKIVSDLDGDQVSLPLSLVTKFEAAQEKARRTRGVSLVQYYEQKRNR